MKNKPYLILIFIFLIIIIINISAFAHKVNIFAYVEGDKVYTENYFSDGKRCIDSKIEVWRFKVSSYCQYGTSGRIYYSSR